MGAKKKSSYMEFAEVMTSIVNDMNVINEKTNKAFRMLKSMPEPVTDSDEAIKMIIDNTTDVFMGSIENILFVLEYYEKAKTAVKRKN